MLVCLRPVLLNATKMKAFDITSTFVVVFRPLATPNAWRTDVESFSIPRSVQNNLIHAIRCEVDARLEQGALRVVKGRVSRVAGTLGLMHNIIDAVLRRLRQRAGLSVYEGVSMRHFLLSELDLVQRDERVSRKLS